MNVGVSPKFTIEALPHSCPGVMGRGPVVSCDGTLFLWDQCPLYKDCTQRKGHASTQQGGSSCGSQDKRPRNEAYFLLP